MCLFIIHDILNFKKKWVLGVFLLSLSNCLFLHLFSSNQWRKRSGKCGLNSNSTLPYWREDLRLSKGTGPPILWIAMSRHIRQVTLLVSWEEKLARILATPSPRGLREGGTLGLQPAAMGRRCVCLPAKSIKTFQVAKSFAQNNSILQFIAPRTPWQAWKMLQAQLVWGFKADYGYQYPIFCL